MQDKMAALFAGEHITDYLQIWKDTLLGAVRADIPDLNNRQMALILIIYLENGPHTVKALAARLNVSKPVISRALDSLGFLGLLKRKRDEKDRRNLFVQRTVKGAVYLNDFAEFIGQSAQRDEQITA